MPKLLIHRISEFQNRLRKIKIAFDGKIVAKIKNGEQLELEIPSGKHSIQAKVDWCSSNILELEIDNSSTIKLDLRSGKGSIIEKLTYGRNEYLTLSIIRQ